MNLITSCETSSPMHLYVCPMSFSLILSIENTKVIANQHFDSHDRASNDLQK